jgi:hypothetical protein
LSVFPSYAQKRSKLKFYGNLRNYFLPPCLDIAIDNRFIALAYGRKLQNVSASCVKLTSKNCQIAKMRKNAKKIIKLLKELPY